MDNTPNWREPYTGPFPGTPGTGPTDTTVARVACWPGCCRHAEVQHDQHGCTVDISADSRWYYRCHDEDDSAVWPRWRDCHTMPDEWLYRLLFKRRGPGWRPWVRYVPRLWKAVSRYAVAHFYCTKDGQCVFRANHRGSCCWGDDGDE